MLREREPNLNPYQALEVFLNQDQAEAKSSFSKMVFDFTETCAYAREAGPPSR
jgi:hypothetical protein